MGYIEVLKSGRTRLKLGSHIMYLEMGSFSNIRQVNGTNTEFSTFFLNKYILGACHG